MKKKKQNDIVLYAVIGVVVFIGTLAVYFWYQNSYFGSNYQKALSSEQTDICATPPGYSDESWREHMSHHPDRYKACLEKLGK